MEIDWNLLNEINAEEFENGLKLVKEEKFINDLKENIKLTGYIKEIAASDLKNEIFVQHLKAGECDKNFRKKVYWEFFAKVLIARKGNLDDVIEDLFIWLKDLEWPGALLIFEFLSQLPKAEFLDHFEKACLSAVKSKDEIRLKNLIRLISYKRIDMNELKDKAMVRLLKEIGAGLNN